MDEKYIVRGEDVLEEEIPNVSLGQYMLDGIRKLGNGIAQVDGMTGQTVTYQEILRNSMSLAQTMKSWGLRKGDVVSVMSPNCTEFCLPVLASMYLGAVCAPLNPVYTPRELHHAMSISKPSILFCSPFMVDKVQDVLKMTTCIQKVIVFGEEECEDFISFSDCIKKDPAPFKVTPVEPENNIAAILCSSGTTGLPKGVMINHKSIVASIHVIRHPVLGSMASTDTHLALLPMFHAYAFFIQFAALHTGVKSVILPLFDGELFLESIQNYKVTLLTLVPPLMVFLAKHPLVAKYDLSSVREIICGAAPLSSDVQLQVTERIGVKSIRQGYGMTEMTLAALLTPRHQNKFGSSGVLLPRLECKVLDVETGEALGPYKEGELCFRGLTIMKGYCGDKQATSLTIDKDGFLHSGDIGYYDDDKFFYIVDRLKELIKYKGYQVPPAELEALLLTHPAIQDVAVIGIPDTEAGELPRAFVVKQPGNSITEKEIIQFVAGQVSPQKKLHGGVKFLDAIPKTPTGKILRRVLRDLPESKL